jgi:hypothetical protein
MHQYHQSKIVIYGESLKDESIHGENKNHLPQWEIELSEIRWRARERGH